MHLVPNKQKTQKKDRVFWNFFRVSFSKRFSLLKKCSQNLGKEKKGGAIQRIFHISLKK
jgi:hypothetical protein